MPTIVAFLDVLGFRNYTNEDLDGACRLLGHQEFILRLKLQDKKLYPPSSYPDPSLAALAESHLVDSFKHFLPFSDSIFIVSETPDKFARQLSHFLIECFSFVAHAYDNADNPNAPENVKVMQFPGFATREEKWYPPLYRGGLSIGDVVVGGVTGIENGGEMRMPNLAGPAAVKAVLIEKQFRGPRLFCEAGFENNFSPDVRHFFRPVTVAVSELLWPAFVFNPNNKAQTEMTEFYKLWGPALGLWKSKRGDDAFEHYDEFLRLLVRSCLKWAEAAGYSKEARRILHKWVSQDLSTDLVESYLE